MAKQLCVVKRVAKFTSTAPKATLQRDWQHKRPIKTHMRPRAGISDASCPIRCSSRERISIPHELVSHWPGSDSNKVEATALATAVVTPPGRSLIGRTDSVLASDWATLWLGGLPLTSAQTLNLTTCCRVVAEVTFVCQTTLWRLHKKSRSLRIVKMFLFTNWEAVYLIIRLKQTRKAQALEDMGWACLFTIRFINTNTSYNEHF